MIIIILKFTIWLTVSDLFLINSEYENQSGFFLMPIIFSPLMKEKVVLCRILILMMIL